MPSLCLSRRDGLQVMAAVAVQSHASPETARRHMTHHKPTNCLFPTNAAVPSHLSTMATTERKTVNIQKEEKTETGQEIVNPGPYIKHPLQHTWTMWWYENVKGKTWQANLRLISKVDTIEDFWALYYHIKLPSTLKPGCDYSLFKDGIEPMWEDEKNKRGGRWLLTLNIWQRTKDLDRLWLDTLMCLIGESFGGHGNEVCGAVVNVRRKGYKIAVWTTDCDNTEAIIHIGSVYKERLGLSPEVGIVYHSHEDSATRSGSTTKNRFVV
ncbi:eukaryotic translation initiation factor 4E-like [Dendropsophus ebraccatus]|uniref:eukaryotic translation initiation factor 4E-like n=1 Tax=Dendropsophus ebraccatus TaxID=150705 RepID=UPI003831762C